MDFGILKDQCEACGGHLKSETGGCLGCTILDHCTWALDGSGCWSWTGARRGEHGMMRVGQFKIRNAHRVAFAAWVAPVEARMDIRHTCGDKLCCRPDHLTVTRCELPPELKYGGNVRAGGRRVWGETVCFTVNAKDWEVLEDLFANPPKANEELKAMMRMKPTWERT